MIGDARQGRDIGKIEIGNQAAYTLALVIGGRLKQRGEQGLIDRLEALWIFPGNEFGRPIELGGKRLIVQQMGRGLQIRTVAGDMLAPGELVTGLGIHARDAGQ